MDALLEQDILAQLPSNPNAQYFLAFSGGLDSHALLHILVQLKAQGDVKYLTAWHVNHQLQQEAVSWDKHCAKICAAFQIPYQSFKVKEKPQPGESIEAFARRARYALFAKNLPQDAYLLTAHHQDDQAETVLLQLMRGSGVAGIAAMPHISKLGKGFLLRPNLQFTREQLRQYAFSKNLNHLHDPMNAEIRFARTFIREEVLPLLQQRWPAVGKTLSRVAQHMAETETLCIEIAEMDAALCINETQQSLQLNNWRKFSPARRINVLRYFLKRFAAIPSSEQLQQIIENLIFAKQDANPVVHFANFEVRRYQDELYIMQAMQKIPKDLNLVWDLTNPLMLPYQLGTLIAVTQKFLSCTIRLRQGGEKICIHHNAGTQCLKKLFQQWGIPPWQRGRTPLIFLGDELIAIPNYAIAQNMREQGLLQCTLMNCHANI